ncbi:MAG: sulfide/dihydroorotate dehydrogenase-like FAD/NAD-binding protein [Candidatus Bathyarchaeota archaeon]|jgi:ferredoxin--NADP+ reductase|nr:sulfide/dihydroorotate dehydrogenase-like FAD/NAD-binding protein [Candidatus Bathyarchaeota archaeon A05DMB-5]MDH7558138.1 sulfide/dihydroorotate dehydrogenase-like FAD/NAD-binding protein [Candidatus Bathyarchaeota archaeon]
MYKILKNEELAPKIKLFEVYAPEMAEKAKPGQFIIVIVDEKGERVPLTIADYDAKKGTISFVFNEVGKSTKQLGLLKKGDSIWNITGPLGNPSEIKHFGRVLCVAGGVMIAPMRLQVKALRYAGNVVVTVVGARIKDLLFYEDEIKALSNEFYVATDDGSKGFKGLDFLKDVLAKEKFDRCVVMGPVVMMKNVSEITKPFGIPTVVTLTPIMVDGMGMCGVCRVTVDRKMMFGCVDGPEFDGHKVDFDGLIKRQRMFLPEERLSSLLWELHGGCRCGGK